MIVVFDLVGVLVADNGKQFWELLGGQAIDQKRLSGEVNRLARQYECGILHTNEMLEELHKLFERRHSLSKIKVAMEAMIGDPVEGMTDLVNRIRQNHFAGLLSNTNELHYSCALRKAASVRLLHPHFLSFKLGNLKPSRDIYEKVVRDFGVEPSTIVFVDDSIENIQGAVAVGINGHHFRSVDALESDLKLFGFSV